MHTIRQKFPGGQDFVIDASPLDRSQASVRTLGPAYRREEDELRVCTQMLRIREHKLEMSARGRWETLSEICAALEARWRCRFPEASVSAQRRHLNKAAFGSHRLKKRRRGGPGYGLFEYTLLEPGPVEFAQSGLFASAGIR
jgi:hypothetical protein